MFFKKRVAVKELPLVAIKKIRVRRNGAASCRSYVLTLPKYYMEKNKVKVDAEITVYGIAGKENQGFLLLEFPRNPVTGQD